MWALAATATATRPQPTAYAVLRLGTMLALRLSKSLHPVLSAVRIGGQPRGVISGCYMATVATSQSNGVTFGSADEHTAWLEAQSALPKGFRVGTHTFSFQPRELPEKTARMTLTLIVLDKPTNNYAAMFTSNAFPGAPVLVGRERLRHSHPLQAVVVNNKISNVCAPGGVEDSERICAALALELGLKSGATSVLPSSTGVIGCVRV